MKLVNYLELDSFLEESSDAKTIIIFGAGKAGKVLASYSCGKTKKKVLFCDNNVVLQNKEAIIPIYSVDEAIKEHNSVFLVGFMENDSIKLASAEKCLKEKGIEEEKVLYIDMQSGIYDAAYSQELQRFVELQRPLERKKIKRVKNICFLSYGFNEEKEKNITGGPSGAICMQKRYLKNSYRSIKILYPYYHKKKEQLVVDRFPHITDAIIQAQSIGNTLQDTIYVANDIFSAYGLYLAGENYILIFHAQGDIVCEMTKWGIQLGEIEKNIFYEIEKLTVQNAFRVLFPSLGAEAFFRNSFEKNIYFTGGEPLYNTINEFPVIQSIDKVVRDGNCLTFLSIGQMTELKGMDRIPDFIDRYARYSQRKIRWICVANGVLKEQVCTQMNNIIKNNPCVEFINIDYKITHGQIFYLMSVCDVYLMLHRVSIFDFSTLEAMYCKKAIILSNIPGNDEFDKEQNVFLFSEHTSMSSVNEFIDEKEYFGMANYKVYNKYFSEIPFVERYHKCLNEFVNYTESNYGSTIN